ncbi:MAG: PQQ-binding-like beta-propeller repeat protein [Anaerolineales bacterium]
MAASKNPGDIPPETDLMAEPAAEAGTIKAGETLQERYLIVKTIGVGGMGAVYQARDMRFPNVTKLVAVKEMINHAADPVMRNMIVRNFEREADLLATLSHPAIPKIFDYFSSADRSYLVMEYIDGQDLEAILDATEGFLNPEQVVEWAIELCDVLAYLHGHEGQPLVFRDMKPSNVMIDRREHVRLIDFGIARDFRSGQRGTMIGTEGYSPPEQYRGEASPQGDIYALGATLHHLLTKSDPRLEAPFSFAERPIESINPNVSADLIAVVNTALAYEPADRFPDAISVRNALRAVKFGHEVPVDKAKGTIIFTELDEIPDAETGGIAPLWKFKCEDEIRTTPLVADGRVFVSAYDHNVYALNLEDGSFVWKFAAEAGFAASPMVEKGSIYIGSEDTRFYALAASTGRKVWQLDLGAPVRCTASFAAGHVFVGSDQGYLHAINVQYGRESWRFDASGAVRSHPVIDSSGEGRVYFGTENGELYCVNFSGDQKWRFRAKRAITASPALHQGMVAFASMDWTVYAVEADTGWAIWRFRGRRAFVSSPAFDPDGKRLYVGGADGNMYAVNVRNGKQVWEFETEDQIASSPLVSNGRVYFGSVDGHIYCVDALLGDLVWKYRTEGAVISSSIVHNEVVYVGSGDGHVYALAA